MGTPVLGTVATLHRFPVKSFQGEVVPRALLTPTGLVGDRAYAVVDRTSGQVVTAKREGRLLEASARTVGDGTVVLALPGGTELAADDPAVHDALSAWLDRPCRLATPEPGAAPTFEMSLDAEHPDRDVFDWPVLSGTFLDAGAAHLVTTASIGAARALAGEGDWDVRRFRPTLVVDCGDATGFVEDEWVGSAIAVGTARLTVETPTLRCPMPSRAQAGLPHDLGVARTLRDHHGSLLGVYAAVVVPGDVAVGDPVALA